jgi:hypothetical protein
VFCGLGCDTPAAAAAALKQQTKTTLREGREKKSIRESFTAAPEVELA